MKRLQIYIDESVDDQLRARAAEQGTSKAALIREAVDRVFGEQAGDGTDSDGTDALDELVGRYDGQPGAVDDVLYGPAR